MIQFKIDNDKEGIEVYIDSKGIDELIGYLSYIKNKREHIHLVVGNELIDDIQIEDKTTVKHVKLIYIER